MALQAAVAEVDPVDKFEVIRQQVEGNDARRRHPAPFGYPPRWELHRVLAVDTVVDQMQLDQGDADQTVRCRLMLRRPCPRDLGAWAVHCVAVGAARDGAGLRFVPWAAEHSSRDGAGDPPPARNRHRYEVRCGEALLPPQDGWWCDASEIVAGKADGDTVDLWLTPLDQGQQGAAIEGIVLLLGEREPLSAQDALTSALEVIPARRWLPLDSAGRRMGSEEARQLDAEIVIDTVHTPVRQQALKQAPGKGKDCEHADCFDLGLWLQAYAEQGVDTCPICGEHLLPSQLVHDPAYERQVRKSGYGRIWQRRSISMAEHLGCSSSGPTSERSLSSAPSPFRSAGPKRRSAPALAAAAKRAEAAAQARAAAAAAEADSSPPSGSTTDAGASSAGAAAAAAAAVGTAASSAGAAASSAGTPSVSSVPWAGDAGESLMRQMLGAVDDNAALRRAFNADSQPGGHEQQSDRRSDQWRPPCSSAGGARDLNLREWCMAACRRDFPGLRPEEVREFHHLGASGLCRGMMDGAVEHSAASRWWRRHYIEFEGQLSRDYNEQRRQGRAFQWDNEGPLMEKWFLACSATQLVADACELESRPALEALVRLVQQRDRVPPARSRLARKLKDFCDGGAYGGRARSSTSSGSQQYGDTDPRSIVAALPGGSSTAFVAPEGPALIPPGIDASAGPHPLQAAGAAAMPQPPPAAASPGPSLQAPGAAAQQQPPPSAASPGAPAGVSRSLFGHLAGAAQEPGDDSRPLRAAGGRPEPLEPFSPEPRAGHPEGPAQSAAGRRPSDSGGGGDSGCKQQRGPLLTPRPQPADGPDGDASTLLMPPPPFPRWALRELSAGGQLSPRAARRESTPPQVAPPQPSAAAGAASERPSEVAPPPCPCCGTGGVGEESEARKPFIFTEHPDESVLLGYVPQPIGYRSQATVYVTDVCPRLSPAEIRFSLERAARGRIRRLLVNPHPGRNGLQVMYAEFYSRTPADNLLKEWRLRWDLDPGHASWIIMESGGAAIREIDTLNEQWLSGNTLAVQVRGSRTPEEGLLQALAAAREAGFTVRCAARCKRGADPADGAPEPKRSRGHPALLELDTSAEVAAGVMRSSRVGTAPCRTVLLAVSFEDLRQLRSGVQQVPLSVDQLAGAVPWADTDVLSAERSHTASSGALWAPLPPRRPWLPPDERRQQQQPQPQQP
eukprot:TRINITY_DN5647_c2_g2_i5.p1 TRINITY_DN5647_c2_g2~~TRINITY_DN5647_c2_g2_i5.p1  ORF type:complete len:1186 (+),score=234.16 TRINITY_DN5647_c2_g2_i5:88-3645(+)